MAKHPADSHDSDSSLSGLVDRLIRRLGPGAGDASDVGTETAAARRTGGRPSAVAYATPQTPKAVGRRWRSPGSLRRWAWLRVALGMLLGLAVLEWPYGRACGLPLAGYLGVVAFIVMTALWAGVHTWRTHIAAGHVLSFALLAWGVVLAAGEVLPRTGYARAEAAWVCTVDGVTGGSAAVAPD